MFRIKICGVTVSSDARRIAQSGADAIGLNFYAESKRRVSLDTAAQIVESVRATCTAQAVGQMKIIGVFVNSTAEEIQHHVRQVPLDAVQLHGDEPTELLRELQPISCIRALRIRSHDDPRIGDIQDEWQEGLLQGVLIDAFDPDAYGGTGKTVAWNWIPQLKERWPEMPTFLAGGLTPENVASAIRMARPDGVDVASGVESSPGSKSSEKVEAFVAAADGAFNDLEPSVNRL